MIAVENDLVPAEEENHILAIKKMINVFEHKFYAKRILRELRMLRLLKHSNIIRLNEVLLPRSRVDFSDIYGVFEIMDGDLHTAIHG